MWGRRRYLRHAASMATLAVVGGCSQERERTDPDVSPDGSEQGGTPTEPLDVPASLPRPALGNPDAAVVVDVYEDFACPECKTYHEQTFGKLQENYIEQGTIHYVFHDYPKVSRSSWALAGGARAVQYDVGEDAFWSFVDDIYRDWLAGAGPAEIGRRAAAAVDARPGFVERVVEERAFRAFLEGEVAAASDAGAPFVPSTFVNGTFVVPNYHALAPVIDATLEET